MKFLGIMFTMITASLFAEVSITDGELKAVFDNGAVNIYYHQGQKLAMTLKPEPALQKVYAESIPFSKTKTSIIVRGSNGSFAVILNEKTLQVPGTNGIKKLNVTMNAEAVILPDSLGEDELIQPQKKPLRIPNFLTHFRVLANNQDLIVNCINSAAPADVVFYKESGKTKFSFPQSNGENLIFTILSEKGIWAKYNGVTDEFKTLDWKPPFPACFVVSFNRKGERIAYPLIALNNWPYNYRVGCVFVTIDNLTNHDSPTSWDTQTSFISYPFVINKENVVKLRLPSKGTIKAGDYYADNVYIYALGPFVSGYQNIVAPTPGKYVFPVQNPMFLPQKYLPPYARNPFAKNRTFLFPVTCETTVRVEKAFTKGTVQKEAESLCNQLNRMDMFQAGIRSRIEQYMRWSENMKNIMQSLPNYKQEYELLLNGFKQIYDSYHPRIRQVSDCHALSQEMRKLIYAKGSDEEQEERVKELGRAIRNMGGGQDGCVGHMRGQAKKIRAKLLREYVYGTPNKTLDWKISVLFDDMDRLLNAYIGMEGK